jgi:CRP-like cAMP-binding protein
MDACIIRELCIELRPKTFSAGDFVYRFGNRAVEGIVFIRKGIAKVFAQDSKQNKILSRGQYHDTNALFSTTPRTDSLKALSSLDVVMLSKSSFDIVMETYASVDPESIQRAIEDFQSMLIADSLEDDPSSTRSSPVPQEAGPNDCSDRVRQRERSGSFLSDRLGTSIESERSAKNTSEINMKIVSNSDQSSDAQDFSAKVTDTKRQLILELDREIHHTHPLYSQDAHQVS